MRLLAMLQMRAVWRAEQRASDVLEAQGEAADWSQHHELAKSFYPRWLKLV